MVHITAGSNIYISALHFGGPPNEVLMLARAGHLQLAISDNILEEVTRVLLGKFGWTQEAVGLARGMIREFTERIVPTQTLHIVKDDPTDDRILECALEAKSEYLITRDKHLLRIKNYGAIKIVLAAEFLQWFRGRGST